MVIEITVDGVTRKWKGEPIDLMSVDWLVKVTQFIEDVDRYRSGKF